MNILNQVRIGDRVKFKKEKTSYLVLAKNDRYMICMKPFNAVKGYFYTVIDREIGMRGPVMNSIYISYRKKYNLKNKEDISVMMEDLIEERSYLDPRDSIELDLDYIKQVGKK